MRNDLIDVVIVGGGAAGALVAIHLLRTSAKPIRVAIVEPRACLGQGVAYSTSFPEHLLNVVAGRMSAFEDDPGHFVRYLESAAERPGGDDRLPFVFAQRREYARYLRMTLESGARGESLHVRDEAVDIDGAGPYTLTLRSGRQLSARFVVLAAGNFPRALPLPSAAMSGQPRIDEAWDYPAIRTIEPDQAVCIVGSGLSMVDVAVTLAERRHRGAIHVVSRHGLMPLPHAQPGPYGGDIGELLAMTVRARLHALRARTAAARQAGEPWQWTMDRLRPHGEALWRSLDNDEQRRFLRHGARFWDIHRHRIAPAVFAQLEALRNGGQLRVHAGHLQSLRQEADDCRVGIRLRGGGDLSLPVQRVVNGTGVESRLPHMPGALMRNLAARGVATAGSQGLGLATDEAGALRAQDGTVHPHLLALGASRIGQKWESIAIPELRRQAQEIAARLLPQWV